jgi:hypothetical protein
MQTTSQDQADRSLHTTGPRAHLSKGWFSLFVRNTNDDGYDDKAAFKSHWAHLLDVKNHSNRCTV